MPSFFDAPILNSPYEYPSRHWELDSEGLRLLGIALLAAGIAMGLGTLGPGISSGRTAAAACKEIARDPELYSSLARSSIFAQGIIDTAAIYVLLASALIILFV